MKVNLLQSFKQTVGSQLVGRLSGFLGEPTEQTSAAMNILLPALIASIVQKSSKANGIADLSRFMEEEGMNGNLLSNMSTLFTGGEATEGLLAQGEKVTEFIFGKGSTTHTALINELSTKGGINRGSSNTLIRLVSPMMMGLLSRHIHEQDLDQAGMQRLLTSQIALLKEEAPESFYERMSLPAMVQETESKDTETEEAKIEAPAPPQPSVLSKIGPWLILGSLALGMLLAMRACGGRDDGIAAMEAEAQRIADSIRQDSINRLKAESGKEQSTSPTTSKSLTAEHIAAAPGSFIRQIHAHLYSLVDEPDKPYQFDEIAWRDSSTILTAPSLRQIDHLATLLQAYPNAVIRLKGYSMDGVDIARARAEAIQQALVEMGVTVDRIITSGQQVKKSAASEAKDAPISERIELYIEKL